ncbi:dynein regulatory complex subunit 3-like [Mytilus californianus]|uniref:dynein regulatory complex subunit 3-like n=1 Tax=Mytilus californianus TaxID=6549 RepID=UPI0022463891|nr:dynein regulatory complex subunit 3-like [Mytilus californianus]
MSTVNSMSRMYDNLEPTVIDEDLLRSAVEEQGPKEEAGKIAKAEGIDFGDVRSLRLDFKNVLTIDNLWEFTALTKLQLDNNIIEKIEGLDSLVNLIWLDLSFNNIEVIEGLGQLSKLEDLTLYSNRISKIENMDNLENLQVFSIGNNVLKDLENVIYLRKFKKLKTLTLKGNPFCEEETYKQYVIAFLSDIGFLDYKLVHQQAREAAIEKYMIPREEMLHNEKQANAIIEEENKRKKEVELHKIAYVENMDSDSLFESLYTEDAEGKKLAEFPAISELIESFREKFVAVCYQIFEYGIKEHEKRQLEVNQFWECIEEAKNENKLLGMKAIDEFMVMKKKVLQELTQISDQRLLEQQVSDYNKVIAELWDKLMGYELQLVDQLEEVVKDFERNLQDMVSMFIESIMAFMSTARDLENSHHEKLSEIALPIVDKLAKNELDDEISEDVRMLFVDKDTIINAISTSHDYHLLKIDNKEEDMMTRLNNWMKGLLEKIHEEEEIQRNRLRVVEINHLIDHLRDEIDNLEVGTAGGY